MSIPETAGAGEDGAANINAAEVHEVSDGSPFGVDADSSVVVGLLRDDRVGLFEAMETVGIGSLDARVKDDFVAISVLPEDTCLRGVKLSVLKLLKNVLVKVCLSSKGKTPRIPLGLGTNHLVGVIDSV